MYPVDGVLTPQRHQLFEFFRAASYHTRRTAFRLTLRASNKMQTQRSTQQHEGVRELRPC